MSKAILNSVSDTPENEDSEFEESEETSGAEFWPNYIPVPTQFHSFMEEGPFSKCTLCFCARACFKSKFSGSPYIKDLFNSFCIAKTAFSEGPKTLSLAPIRALKSCLIHLSWLFPQKIHECL